MRLFAAQFARLQTKVVKRSGRCAMAVAVLMLDSAAHRTQLGAAVQRSHIYRERGRLLREPSLCRGPTSWLPLSGLTNIT